MSTPDLVTVSWLNEHKDQVVILDGTYHSLLRDAEAEFKQSHIKNARFFNIDEVKDRANPFPHMVPDAQVFSQDVSALGISNSDHIVVYDTYGILTSPRVWWLFKIFGHEKVSVLDGGLPGWIQAGLPVTAEVDEIKPSTFVAKTPDAGRVIKYPTVLSYVSNPESAPQLVDARPTTRFHGESLEPRVGIPSGHIPTSLNTPLVSVVDQETGKLHSPTKLKEIFESSGVDLKKPIVATCDLRHAIAGSGVTACGLVLALDLLGVKDVPVYDGSFTEYVTRAEADGFQIAKKGPVRQSVHDK
ncbi:hypothetical protein HDU93_008598 [Gonapodya sp. JEL0774]|nr:hypothetical protein HDU93_008598 [Gonapodya sp. JEL0774]